MSKKLTQEEFKSRGKEIHSDEYDYSKVVYVDMKTKVIIIHNKCGTEFEQTPSAHLQGKGCRKCSYEKRGMEKRSLQEHFIKKSHEVHGKDQYDYSLVNYVDSKIKILLVCNKCGHKFKQEPNSHLNGCGCPICALKKNTENRRKTKENFVEKANNVHSNFFNYDKFIYIDNKTKSIITCPIHGDYEMSPLHHLNGQKCHKCTGRYRRSQEDWEQDARAIHGNNYDYSISKFENINKKLLLKCNICKTEFEIKPSKHLIGQGCPKCRYVKSANSNRRTLDDFISESIKKHGNKYDYSKTNYIADKTKLTLICKTCGNEFEMTPNNHLNSYHPQGCPVCSEQKRREKRTYTTEIWIEKAKGKHGDKYLYDKSEYINSETPLLIGCKKEGHGYFQQIPRNHLQGQGCPICKESKLEQEIAKFLDDNNIKYERGKFFSWLKYKRHLELDFYLPDYNVGIECQGKQHFGIGNWEKDNKNLLLRDEVKQDLCNKNGVKLLYYSNLGINYPYEVFENKEELLKEIKCED